VVLLSVLQVMHVWWFCLLARIGIQTLTAGDIHAAGENEYEGPSDIDK